MVASLSEHLVLPPCWEEAPCRRSLDVFAEATGPGGSEPLAPASRVAPADLLWNLGPPALEPVAFVSLRGGSSQVSPRFWAFLPSQL